MAGLARKVFEFTGSRYHAGLWEETLHMEPYVLGWKTVWKTGFSEGETQKFKTGSC